MFYCFSLIPFQFFIHLFLIHTSGAISSGDDKILIAFMKGHQEMQISEYSIQKYESHLGILYYMRKNWQCDKIADEFEEYERTECQKYRKYLDILYEYLSSEYVGIPKMKPKFVFKYKKIEIEGPIIYAMICLRKISQFYWQTYQSNTRNKLNNFFLYNFEPKLLNENRLNYEPKLPINEMILELAIDTSNECQTNESLNGIIQQNFDENLGQMIILFSAFDDSSKWIEDALFSEFVKGQVATNFEEFSKKFINKYSKEYLENYEEHLCVVYFIRENWHQCEAICKDNANCQMYRKHLHILYEYLFRLYAEAKCPNESIQLSPVIRPIFVGETGKAISLIEVISNFNFVAKYSCDKAYDWATKDYAMELVNEVELNYDENNKEDLNGSTKTDQIMRKEFKQKMKKICKGKSKELERTLWITG